MDFKNFFEIQRALALRGWSVSTDLSRTGYGGDYPVFEIEVRRSDWQGWLVGSIRLYARSFPLNSIPSEEEILKCCLRFYAMVSDIEKNCKISIPKMNLEGSWWEVDSEAVNGLEAIVGYNPLQIAPPSEERNVNVQN